ncbi:ribosome maturation factor RimM [Allorhizocola rhizosphaerae]|uniref:ribosome maturation factor RimM n=1 Tax=Allorhizocola rhizosphaerae TaxID=1872709 RepID=UPI001478FEDD|nr:ribosome maturation factor RimM [Allorhizocola rhizosphaerae]
MLTVGQIVRPHGIRGEVIVEVRTDEPELRFREGSVVVAGPSRLTVTSARPHLGRLIVTFAEIPDRDAAEAARGLELEVDSEAIEPPSDPDEFHDHQLVGLTVITVGGELVGRVARVEHAPASDLLLVRNEAGKIHYVPFVRSIVPTVDLPAQKVVIDPPGGLLEL